MKTTKKKPFDWERRLQMRARKSESYRYPFGLLTIIDLMSAPRIKAKKKK